MGRELEYKHVPLTEFKGLDDSGDGTIEGYAAIFGNLDAGGDIILPGAFAATLDEYKRRGFMAKSHDWSVEGEIGFPLEVHEDDVGLYVKAKFYADEAAQTVRRRARDRMRHGKDVSFSIGYAADPASVEYIYPHEYKEKLPRYVKAQFLPDAERQAARFERVRLLKSIRVFEHSIVTVPMNQYAQAIAVKGAAPAALAADLDGDTVKGATGAGNLPLAPRDRPWNQDEANRRVREWAAATDAPNAKYRRAFFWYDADNAGNFTAYKLQFADVIGDQLHAVPRAIFAVAAVLEGARGGVSIPDEDKVEVRRRVTAYYARMRKEFDDNSIVAPWEEKGLDVKGLYEDEINNRTGSVWALTDALDAVLWHIVMSGQEAARLGVPFDTAALLDEALAEFASRLRPAILDQINRARPGKAQDETVAYELMGLDRNGTRQPRPHTGLSFADHSNSALAAVRGFTERARALHNLRVKEGRVLSAANRERMEQLRAIIVDELLPMIEEMIRMAQPRESAEPQAPRADTATIKTLLSQIASTQARLAMAQMERLQNANSRS
jgi:HK97 family phage prohead protease